MSLNGSAFLALWNDVDPARDAEYNCWHTFEHVPERVGIQGILSGRRYIAGERSKHRYFTLYELAGLPALAGPEYVDVVENPTEWTLSMRPSLRNFQRHPCTTLFSAGMGIAGSIATFRFSILGTGSDLDFDTARTVFEPLLGSAGITSIHLGRADPGAAFPLKNAPAPIATEGSLAHVLLVEGIARTELEGFAAQMVATIEKRFTANQVVEWKSFVLAQAITRSDLKYPTTQRQPGRPELHARW